jgi:ATP-dependent Clp protease ATP-binding subunit ClpX
LGFGADIKPRGEKNLRELFTRLHPDDLIKFGMIPEFIGRLPIHVALDDLTKNDLRRIITEPKNSVLRQYKASLKLDEVDLVFEDEAVEAIADKAISQKTGARGLRSIVESMMMDVMFDLPSEQGAKRVVINRDVVEGKIPCIVERGKKTA